MKREALLRELRKEARKRGVIYREERDAGKGSHYMVYFDKKNTIIKSGELSPTYVKLIKKQLGLM